jgi:hypothetical protein
MVARWFEARADASLRASASKLRRHAFFKRRAEEIFRRLRVEWSASDARN